MKKRINTIDGKILVQGGTDNELRSNEIRVNADKTLTERIDGKIVSAGGSSGTGGELRPVTADDVILYNTNQFGEEELPFSNTIVVPENNGFGIKIKDTKKSLFFNGRTAVLINGFESGEFYFTGSIREETTINIKDVYIKD